MGTLSSPRQREFSSGSADRFFWDSQCLTSLLKVIGTLLLTTFYTDFPGSQPTDSAPSFNMLLLPVLGLRITTSPVFMSWQELCFCFLKELAIWHQSTSFGSEVLEKVEKNNTSAFFSGFNVLYTNSSFCEFWVQFHTSLCENALQTVWPT